MIGLVGSIPQLIISLGAFRMGRYQMINREKWSRDLQQVGSQGIRTGAFSGYFEVILD